MAPLPGVPGDELASAGMKRKLPPPTQAEIQPANIAPRTTRFEKKEGYGFEDSFGKTDGRSFHRYDYHTLCLLLHHVLKSYAKYFTGIFLYMDAAQSGLGSSGWF
jgi:hypothetical protein